MAQTASPALRFSIRDGLVDNEFLREGPVAAHLLQSAGTAARLLIAFPAGNGALGLWFEPGPAEVHWHALEGMRACTVQDRAGRTLHGVEALARTDCASLTVRAVVMSSARVLRDYQFDGRLPQSVRHQVSFGPDRVCWERDRIDGAPGFSLSLEVAGGVVGTDAQGRVTLSAAPGATLALRLRGASGATPLVPMELAQLLRAPDSGSERARNSLAFLSYEDKLLAGSWRFNTYFGRDTLMSLLLLMPALTAPAIEAGLGSVLTRVNGAGEVAHEEDIGECALLHGSARAAPIYDYKMVDDDFMLAPVAAAYLIDTPDGAARAPAFLARPGYRAALAANAALVLERGGAFARQPCVAHLVQLKPGQITGDWRDSADGLGGGRSSYNVNAVLVPAALRAIAALAAAGLLPAIDGGHAGMLATVWETHVPGLFAFEREAGAARLAVLEAARHAGVAPGPALDSLDRNGVRFHAIALDQAGAPVPVLHSDFGFALMLQAPPAAMIEAELSAIMRPFPAGLMTGVGLLVANGAYGDSGSGLNALFGSDRYHGAVVWSWQQALLAAGLERQLRRADLPASTVALLRAAQAELWQAIGATAEMGNSELWSWRYSDGGYQMAPFGPECATADESNAAQLWSTVYLAVRAPAPA